MSGGGKDAALGHGELGEFVEELGLIAFDDQEVVGVFVFDDVSRRGFLSIDRVSANQGSAEVQSIQQILERGNFVGLGRNFDLTADDSGLGIQSAEQLERLAVDLGSGAEAFSIDGQGRNAQILEVGAEPVADNAVQFFGIQTLQDAPDCAFAWRHKFVGLGAASRAQTAELVLVEGLRELAYVDEAIVAGNHGGCGDGDNGGYFAMKPASVAAGIAQRSQGQKKAFGLLTA